MPLGTSDFDYLRSLLRERAAIVLVERDLGRVRARLEPVARANGAASVQLLVARMRARPQGDLQAQAVDALVAHATPFLLDGRVGTYLAERVIPHLVTRRAATRRLRFWCPACGTGQEPYSIALTLRERFPELAGWDVSILASDASPAHLERAIVGSYSAVEVAHGLPAPVLVKHFVKDGDRWRLKDDVRASVRFAELNLREPWPELETMDAIFMRNVLVHYAPAVRRPLLARLRAVLAPDGFLFLGSADADALLDQRFQKQQDEKSGFYQPLT